MSKLTASLRESITAEKQSVEEKDPAAKLLATKTPVKAAKTTVKAQHRENATIKAKPDTLFDELTDKLKTKNLPLPLNYEALSLLMRANLLEKFSNNISNASNMTAGIVRECIEAPLCSISEVVNLNATTSCQALDRASNVVQELATTKNPIEFLTCLNQIIVQNVENSKNYWQELSATIGASRQKMNKALDSQRSYTWQQVTQAFNPWQ